MQRSAAATPLPPSPSHDTDSPASDRPSKRVRLSNSSYHSPASSHPSTPVSDARALADLLAVEEIKRAQVIEREGWERGESRWVLKTPKAAGSEQGNGVRVVMAGYGDLDVTPRGGTSSDEAGEDEAEAAATTRPQVMGRRSFGNFNRAEPKAAKAASEHSSDDEDDEDDEGGEDHDDDPASARSLALRAQLEAERKASRASATQLAETRRSKEVKLNRLTSISGGGGGGGGNNWKEGMTCHSCGRKGHFQSDCPDGRSGRGKNGRKRESQGRGEELDY